MNLFPSERPAREWLGRTQNEAGIAKCQGNTLSFTLLEPSFESVGRHPMPTPVVGKGFPTYMLDKVLVLAA